MEEASALGAAILAGVAIGVYDSYEQAIKATVKIKATYQPRPEIHQIYKRQHEIYKQLVEALKLVNKGLCYNLVLRKKVNMRILGLTDTLKEKDLDKGVKEAFPNAEVRYLEWPAAALGILSKENLNIEKNGAEVGMPIPGILEVVRDFDPEVIITHFAPVTREVIEKARVWK